MLGMVNLSKFTDTPVLSRGEFFILQWEEIAGRLVAAYYKSECWDDLWFCSVVQCVPIACSVEIGLTYCWNQIVDLLIYEQSVSLSTWYFSNLCIMVFG